MAGLRTDEEHRAFLDSSKASTAVVKYGASWCLHCKEVFPQYLILSRKVTNTAALNGLYAFLFCETLTSVPNLTKIMWAGFSVWWS